MEITPLYLWLLAGIIFCIAEAVGISGFGLIFAGFGALSIGLLLNFGAIPEANIALQFVLFFAITALWAAVLWKPLQKWRTNKSKSAYHNMIGQAAIVAKNGLSKQHGGEVVWSGAIMKAKFANAENEVDLESGSQVIIQDIIGNSLIVTSKHKD